MHSYDASKSTLRDFAELATTFEALEGILNDRCLKPGGGWQGTRPLCAATLKTRHDDVARKFRTGIDVKIELGANRLRELCAKGENLGGLFHDGSIQFMRRIPLNCFCIFRGRIPQRHTRTAVH